MLRKFYPCAYADTVFDIDYQKLYQQGYRGILFDIDNTLVLHGADSTPEVDRLFRQIHRTGLKTLLLSNNSEERILRFLAHIDAPYIAEADKPAPQGYEKALALLGLPKEQVLAVGDQIFTDIYGANRCGIDAFFPILRGPCSEAEAMDPARAAANLTAAAEQVTRLIAACGWQKHR